MNSSPKEPDLYDLVIVGAGPVGLLAALGAARRGCERLLVLEQAREFTEAGRGVDLQPNGTRALRMIAPDVYENLSASHTHTGWKPWPVYDYDGTYKFSIERTSGGDRTIPIKWWKLQRALLEGLGDNVEIRNDAYVSTLDHFSDRVQVTYMKNRPRFKKVGVWGQDTPEEDAARVDVFNLNMVGKMFKCGYRCIISYLDTIVKIFTESELQRPPFEGYRPIIAICLWHIEFGGTIISINM